MTASGSCTSSNGSPPRKRQSSMRAFNSGSSGEVNGNLSIITNDNVSPRTSTPSQKLLVATRSALPALTNCCNSCPLLVSLQQNGKRHGSAELFYQITHHGVRGTKHKQRPLLASMIGRSIAANWRAEPGWLVCGRLRGTQSNAWRL